MMMVVVTMLLLVMLLSRETQPHDDRCTGRAEECIIDPTFCIWRKAKGASVRSTKCMMGLGT